MDVRLGRVAENLTQAGRLVEEAFSKGASWVILPEFFPTGCAFHPAMGGAAMALDGPALRLMRDAAVRHKGHVGGSFIRAEGRDAYDTFLLVRPDGSFATHDKDQPTMWEGCYYRGGSDDGVIEAGGLTAGAFLCWEVLRWRTARRLAGRVDLVVGGSGWWGFPRTRVLKGWVAREDRRAFELMRDSFPRFARILGVPVVHASQCGQLRAQMPLAFGAAYVSRFLGETQVLDGRGNRLAHLRAEDGAGVTVADVLPGRVPAEPMGDGLWIPEMPRSLLLSWRVFNAHARRSYRRATSRRS